MRVALRRLVQAALSVQLLPLAVPLTAGPGMVLAVSDGTAAPLSASGPSIAAATGVVAAPEIPTSGAEDAELDRVQALVMLAQRGDGEAFAQLYDRHVTAVYRYLYLRVGSHAVAEDLTSETFLRALRRLDSFTWQGRDIGAWFLTIARNLVTDHFKSSRFRLEVPTADMADADQVDGGFEEVLVGRLSAAALMEALARLRPDQQECLALRFLQGLSVAETALVMGRSEGAVKQLQLRGLRALASTLPDGLR